jgi:hypothetical protein
MDGIDDKLLSARTLAGKSVLDELLFGAQISRIDSYPTRDYTGRYNLSTTADHFIKAVKWLDTELPLLIAHVPEADRGDFEGCVERIPPRLLVVQFHHGFPHVHGELSLGPDAWLWL